MKRNLAKTQIIMSVVEFSHPILGELSSRAQGKVTEIAPSTYIVTPIKASSGAKWTSPEAGEPIATASPITTHADAQRVFDNWTREVHENHWEWSFVKIAHAVLSAADWIEASTGEPLFSGFKSMTPLVTDLVNKYRRLEQRVALIESTSITGPPPPSRLI